MPFAPLRTCRQVPGSAGFQPARRLPAGSRRSQGEAHLSKLFVAAEARGRGIGRALLAHAVAEARAFGMRRLDLETRSVFREAVGLYEATGWTRGPDLPPGHGPDRTYYLSLEAARG